MDFVHFIGRFHPVFLHLPIGLILGWIAAEIVAIRAKTAMSQMGIILSVMTAVSGIIAVITGYLLSLRETGFNEEILDEHFWQGIGFMIFAIIGAALAVATVMKKEKAMGFSWGSRGFLVLSQLILIPAAHHGGVMTHGPDALSEHAPGFLKPFLGHEFEPVEEVNTKTTYGHVIKPILMKYCGKCHANGKKKGKYNFDTFEGLLTAIEPGDADASWFIETLHLPMDDDEHMPPEDKPQLSPEQIETLTWWINQGASEDALWDPKTAPDFVHAAIVEAPPEPAAEEKGDDTAKAAEQAKSEAEAKAAAAAKAEADRIASAQSKAIEALLANGVSVQLRHSGSDLLDADFSGRGPQATSADFKQLAALAPRLETLSLSRCTQLAAGDLDFLAQANALTELDLGATDADDATIAAVRTAPNLKRLVLSSTKLSAASVAVLAECKQLEKIYLWNSSLDEAAIASIRSALPSCEVNDGSFASSVVIETPPVETVSDATAATALK